MVRSENPLRLICCPLVLQTFVVRRSATLQRKVIAVRMEQSSSQAVRDFPVRESKYGEFLVSNLQISHIKYMKSSVDNCCPHLDKGKVQKKRKSLNCMFRSPVSAQLLVQQCQMWVQWPPEGGAYWRREYFSQSVCLMSSGLSDLNAEKPTQVTLMELPPHVLSHFLKVGITWNFSQSGCSSHLSHLEALQLVPSGAWLEFPNSCAAAAAALAAFFYTP